MEQARRLPLTVDSPPFAETIRRATPAFLTTEDRELPAEGPAGEYARLLAGVGMHSLLRAMPLRAGGRDLGLLHGPAAGPGFSVGRGTRSPASGRGRPVRECDPGPRAVVPRPGRTAGRGNGRRSWLDESALLSGRLDLAARRRTWSRAQEASRRVAEAMADACLSRVLSSDPAPPRGGRATRPATRRVVEAVNRASAERPLAVGKARPALVAQTGRAPFAPQVDASELAGPHPGRVPRGDPGDGRREPDRGSAARSGRATGYDVPDARPRGAPFTEEDLALAQEIADRIGLAAANRGFCSRRGAPRSRPAGRRSATR